MGNEKKSYWQRIKDWFKRDEKTVVRDNSETQHNNSTDSTTECIH